MDYLYLCRILALNVLARKRKTTHIRPILKAIVAHGRLSISLYAVEDLQAKSRYTFKCFKWNNKLSVHIKGTIKKLSEKSIRPSLLRMD